MSTTTTMPARPVEDRGHADCAECRRDVALVRFDISDLGRVARYRARAAASKVAKVDADIAKAKAHVASSRATLAEHLRVAHGEG